jgi:uncharacterized protein (TIGR00266 family)
MDIQIRHNPAFAVARATLAPGESIKAESGAMAATSGGVEVEAKMEGGLMKGLKRSVLGGESLFMTTLTAGPQGGWVDCAARLPGDAFVLDINGAYNLTRGSWLCNEATVNLDTKWGGFKNLAGGEGGFMVHATGTGKVVVSCYGAVEKVTLGAGEQIVVDSGHLVAFSAETSFTTRKVTSGIMQTLKSGEGFVLDFTGPGELYMQARNPSEFVQWLTNVLPFSRN